MSIRNLQHLLSPRSVAVFGASPKPSSVGGTILRNIIAGRFPGPIYPVSPRHDMIEGLAAFPDAGALPAAPDLAVIASPRDTVASIVADLARRGTRAIVAITAGFEGAAQERARAELLAAARADVVRIVGPNCFGLVSPACGLHAAFAHTIARPGNLAFVAQSGAMVAAILGWAETRNVGFSHIVSLGDMIDVDFGDMLDYLALDPNTEAILLYVEAVTQPRKFMSAARAAARLKPVIVVKGGRHAAAAAAAASHTGAVAGSDAVYDAVFARTGLVRVKDLQSLFDAATMLASPCRPRGERLAIVTNGGGIGVIAVDELLDAGGTLAKLDPATITALNGALPAHWSGANPIDIIGDADGARYAAALTAALADPGADAVLVMHCPTRLQDPARIAQAVAEARGDNTKPVLACWVGDAAAAGARDILEKADVPTYSTPDEAVRGFMQHVDYTRQQTLLMQTPPLPADIPADDVATARKIIAADGSPQARWLDPVEVRTLLSLYRIPCNRAMFAATPDQVVTAARAIGGAVALKISSPDIVHKSDVGGVMLNIAEPELAGTAARAMLAAVARTAPQARLSGILVEEMVTRPAARELFLGVTIDRTFGPVVAFGHGGTAVEVVADTAIGLPPLNVPLALAMIARTRISRLLGRYRSYGAVDTSLLASALVSLSQLVTDHPQITDVDINPLLADDKGIVAVDARIRIDPSQGTPRLVIAPYPRDLEEDVALSDGRSAVLRPVRPDDEKALTAMISLLDRQDLRYRFFELMHQVSHQLAARLTQVDYDREMALGMFARAAAGADMWGIAHLFADPDNVAAEFAVVVHPRHRERGIATMLLNRIIALARARGVGLLWGDVLADNRRMLELCAALGFGPARHQPDPKIVRLELKPGS